MGQVVDTVLLEKGLRAEFMKAYNNGENPSEVMSLVTVSQSSSNEEKYGWLGQVPQLAEWKDERVLKGLLDFDYTIPNKHYEATLQIDRNEVADDQLGGIKVRISDLAVKARQHPRSLFFAALVAGTTDLCYDGQAFFSDSHSEGESGTQDNLLAGTGVTVATLKADFIAARAAMRSFKDDQGEPMNEGEMDLYVVAPPALEGVIDELFLANEISSTTNTLKGAAKKIISSRLSDVNDWYLLNAAGSIKPLIQQVRQAPMFAALEHDSDRGFMSRRFLYGVDHRMGFGYGLWQKAIKTVNS